VNKKQTERDVLMELLRAMNLMLNEAALLGGPSEPIQIKDETFDRARRAYDAGTKLIRDEALGFRAQMGARNDLLLRK
jgi:hypothetical protein